MPSNWLYIDSNFPTFTGEESLKEQVTTIQNYMYTVSYTHLTLPTICSV